MLKAKKEELQERGYKGFTLMEMLIVVAIIAVLVAIAIPVFTNQLEKSRESTDMANVRSAYATVTANYLTDGAVTTIAVSANQTVPEWQTESGGQIEFMNGSVASVYEYSAKTTGAYNVTLVSDASGNVTPSVS